MLTGSRKVEGEEIPSGKQGEGGPDPKRNFHINLHNIPKVEESRNNEKSDEIRLNFKKARAKTSKSEASKNMTNQNGISSFQGGGCETCGCRELQGPLKSGT